MLKNGIKLSANQEKIRSCASDVGPFLIIEIPPPLTSFVLNNSRTYPNTNNKIFVIPIEITTPFCTHIYLFYLYLLLIVKCETKLELDRRHVHARIDALAEKLAEMEKRRGESRKARAKTGMPVVSLVGYTNVGKSSLMNALCGPSVAEADMLFATLDPTSRKLVLPSGMAVLLVDTVGFVSRLPHNLVEAFKSTLEEAAWSDVIVRVADAGDDQREEQLAVTDEVLDGLDCADIPRLTVYNKCDKPNALNFDPDILLTSAKTGYGLDALLKKLDELLSDRVHTIRVLLPYDKLGLAAPMRERGSVQVEEYREDGLYLEGIVKTEDLHCFEGYLV